MTVFQDLDAKGWVRFPADPRIARWADAAAQAAGPVLADPEQQARWLQCEGTWFVGVDALPNTPDGSVGGVALEGAAICALAPLPRLHPAQLSAVYPGYPRPRKGESEAAFRYRLRRDGAHVDGLHAEGPGRRRYLREPHRWILGLPLSSSDPKASPLAVWEGSHVIMRRAFRAAFGDRPPEDWGTCDLTEAYTGARREVFETCRRVELSAKPGEAVLLHRLCLHGISPWRAVDGPPRIVAYFRPEIETGPWDWLHHGFGH